MSGGRATYRAGTQPATIVADVIAGAMRRLLLEHRTTRVAPRERFTFTMGDGVAVALYGGDGLRPARATYVGPHGWWTAILRDGREIGTPQYHRQ